MGKPILCLDFDGVCHSYISGWKGADVIPDPPVPGLFDFLEAAKEQFEIHIFSSRSLQTNGIAAMEGWFDAHFSEWMFEKHPEYREKYSDFFGYARTLIFDIQKPAAFLTIDDRAITFTGIWPEVDELKTFQPWYKMHEGTAL